MSGLFASLLVLGVAPAAAAARGAAGKQGFLSARDGMRPEVVALSLSKVEDEWKNQYRLYVECNQTAASEAESRRCLDAPKAFEHSCGKIVTAMVQASGGNRESVHEYMADVCSEPELQGWRQGRCEILAATVLASMTPDSYVNRESLDTQPLCVNFWSRFSAEEDQLLKTERLEAEARQKKEQEEREAEEKRMAEQAAEQEKIRAEEEAREAEAQAEEKRKEEAEKAEAEAAAEKLAAQQKQEEAQATPPPATVVLAAANSTAAVNATAEGLPSRWAARPDVAAANQAAKAADKNATVTVSAVNATVSVPNATTMVVAANATAPNATVAPNATAKNATNKTH